MRPVYLFAILILLNLYFFAGNSIQREKKAEFFSEKIFFPFFNSIKNYKENKKLQKINEEIRNELAEKNIKLTVLKNHLYKLDKISKINLNNGLDYQIADVIGKGSMFYDNTLIINQGKNADIMLDYPVMDYKGIIGKIISIGPNYSVVLPYSNSNFSLSVMLKKNNQQGILKSDGIGNVFVDYLDLNAEVVVGDTVVTSNLSDIFPMGFLVGKVKKIKISKDRMHKIAYLTMFNNTKAVTAVIVLKTKKEKPYEKRIQKLNY